jgi:hypothetical protein
MNMVTKPQSEPTSALLERFINEEKSGDVQLSDFIAKLGDRGFGLIILIFALPNTLPLGIPGISSICAVPIMFFAVQMMLGRHSLWLPKYIGDKHFSEEKFDAILKKSIPLVKWLERFIHPRLTQFSSGIYERLIGAMLFILAAIIFLPIPLGNFIPAICMCLLALGMLHRDGAMVIAGFIAGIATTIGMSYVIIAFLKLVYSWFISLIY